MRPLRADGVDEPVDAHRRLVVEERHAQLWLAAFAAASGADIVAGRGSVDMSAVPRLPAALFHSSVLSYYSESVQAFVARRHGELQRDGHRNREIYTQLLQELQHRRFRAPALTERQLRRWIYG